MISSDRLVKILPMCIRKAKAITIKPSAPTNATIVVFSGKPVVYNSTQVIMGDQ